jgi:hypothetical protein
MKTTATAETLSKALAIVNERFDNNVTYNRAPEKQGKRLAFTLKVKDSRKPGARRGLTGRRSVAACWHVHGYFFDAVWTIEPAAIIDAGALRMTGKADNWQDRNIGSMYQPAMYSEACCCNS